MCLPCVQPLRALVVAAACFAGGAPPLAQAQQPAPGAASPAASEAPRALPKELPLRRDPPVEAHGTPWLAFLLLVGLAAGAGVLLLRRRGAAGLLHVWQGTRARSGIERVASQPLTQQSSVHVVRWNGEEMLLGCTGTQVTLLARRPVADGGGSAS